MTVENVFFKLEIDSGNQAIVDDPSTSVAELLRGIANELGRGYDHLTIADYNGNRVGEWELIIDEVSDDE